VILLFCLFLLLYRKRREVVFGLLWVPLSLLITLPFWPQGRYFFTPSVGMALAFGSILSKPLARNGRRTQWAAATLAALVLVSFEAGAIARTTQYRALGAATQNFIRQLKTLQPQFPPNSQVFVTGLPALGRGKLLVSPPQLEYALQLTYADRSLRAVPAARFPTTLKAPDRTFFFEYD